MDTEKPKIAPPPPPTLDDFENALRKAVNFAKQSHAWDELPWVARYQINRLEILFREMRAEVERRLRSENEKMISGETEPASPPTSPS